MNVRFSDYGTPAFPALAFCLEGDRGRTYGRNYLCLLLRSELGAQEGLGLVPTHLRDLALERETAGLGIDYTAFGSSVAACFERAARLHPHRTAICCQLGDISYAELNAGANCLAHRLLESGGNVGDRVAILMPQDRRIFLAIIATLKTGRIVLVLNGGDHACAH